MELTSRLAITAGCIQILAADNQVTEQEIAYLVRMLGAEAATEVPQAVDLLQSYGYPALIRAVKEQLSPQHRRDLVLAMARMVYADGQLDAEELRLLQQMASGVGLSLEELEPMLDQVRNKMQPKPEPKPEAENEVQPTRPRRPAPGLTPGRM